MIKITAYKYHGVILTYSIDTKVFTERFLTCLILSYAPPWRIWSTSLLKKIASLYSFSIPKKQNMKVWFSPLMVSESVNTLKSVKWVCDISQLITCKSQWASLIIITIITLVVLSNTSKQSGQEQDQQTIQLQQKWRPSMFSTFSSPCLQLLHLKKIKQ